MEIEDKEIKAAPPKDWPKYVKVEEPWEKQGSDILKLPKIPGITRRYLNAEARYSKSGCDGGWQVDDAKHRQKLGDLVSGWMPKDKAEKRNQFFRHKHTRMIKQEQEKRQEIYTQMARENMNKQRMWGGFSFS